MKKMIPVTSYDGEGVEANTEKLIRMAESAGLRPYQFEVKRHENSPMSNHDHRMTLFVTEKGKQKWEERTNPHSDYNLREQGLI